MDGRTGKEGRGILPPSGICNQDVPYRKRGEVKGMCITEYKEAETMKVFREEGEDRLGKLMTLLISAQRTEDAEKAAIDKEKRRTLYKEFDIV